MIEYTLSAKELSNIHNGKCEIIGVIQQLEGVVAEQHITRLRRALELLNAGLEGAYKEEEKQFKTKSSLYDKICSENKFSSIWSMFEVTDFSAVPFPEARAVTYTRNWGKPVDFMLPINPTWLDLWKAADQLIKESGDNHHVFIEDFTPRKENSFILELSTGS